jgi:hypothetical protein
VEKTPLVLSSFEHSSFLRHSAFQVGHFSQLRLDAIQALTHAFWRASLIRRARRGGIVLVERTVELAHKAPLVLGQVQQRTVNQDLTDGRGNNALALTEVLIKAREMRSNHPCSRKLTASRRAFASASSKEALNTPP